MIPGFLIPIIGVLVVVFVAFYGFTTSGYFVHALLLFTPVAIFLVNRPKALMILILGIYPSGLILPGLPAGVQVVHALMAFFIGLTIAHNIVAKPGRRTFSAIHLMLYALLAVLAVTIYVRGLGLRAAGSGQVGGAAYIRLLFGVGFFLCARYYSLTPEQWRRTIFFILAGSFIPMIAQLIFMFSGGAIYQQFMFIQPYVYGLVENLMGAEAGTGFFRLHGLAPMSSILLSIVLVFIPFRGIDRAKVILFSVAILAMASLSGFRSSVLEILGIIVFFTLMSASPGNRVKSLLAMAGVGVFGLIVIIPLLPYMPFPIQRALSWVPFAEVSAMAARDATETITWRFEVWKYCLSFWRDYIWIGRGFTIDVAAVQSLSVMQDPYLHAFLSHNYHNGPISLLLDLGVPGFIVGSLFLFLAARFSLRSIPGATSPFMERFYNLYRAKLLYSVFAFFTIFGDVRTSFIAICMNLAILESMRITVTIAQRRNQAQEQAVDGNKSVDAPTSSSRAKPFSPACSRRMT